MLMLMAANVIYACDEFDWSLFWTSFGAIATALACVVALVESYCSRRRSLKVSCGFDAVAMRLDGMERQSYVRITCCNRCSNAIWVRAIVFEVGKMRTQLCLLPTDPGYVEFPHMVLPGEAFTYNFPRAYLYENWKGKIGNKKIGLYVVDSFGKRYRSACKMKAEDFMELCKDG